MTCNLNLVFNQQHIATQSKKSLVRIYAYLKKIKGYCIKFLCQRRQWLYHIVRVPCSKGRPVAKEAPYN